MSTGIVLAGGRSERFGADKLAADIDGRSLLATTIAAMAGIVDKVIVAGPDLPSDRHLAEDDTTPIALIRDRDPHDGPLAALANVLGSATPTADALAIVVGGDMPRLVSDVLQRMLDRLEADPSLEAVVLARPDSGEGDDSKVPTQVLPMAVRVEPAANAARSALATGRRSLHAMLHRLAWAELPADEWLPLDPDAGTLLDVDTPADLDRLRSGKGR